MGWIWERVGTGLPNVQVTDIQTRQNTADGKNIDLVIATYGRGAWVLPLTRGGVRQAAVGGRAWADAVAAGVSGAQDAGEAGVGGVFVSLLDTDNRVVASTATDEDGQYAFYDLTPGDYRVRFGLPPGQQFVAPGVGDELHDSDALTGGYTATFAVTGDPAADADLLHLDAGLTADASATASVSDLVWDDANGNGVQDSGEGGLAGVLVTLLDGADAPVALAQTDSAGHYAFTGLAAGSYRVAFGTPSGFTPSPAGLGVNAAIDSDADPNTGTTAAFALAAGQSRTDIDAGFYSLRA
ncbi:MAG: carboxypeptidase regulatory-like domain-containing protein, partial [Gemmataceae bacterium]|nr:carboxypeptidase regulatory-like domain-containing protein [Gemmataceae bacterium]